jgi:hypothetical protein
MTREDMLAAADALAQALSGETQALSATGGFAAAVSAAEAKRRAVEEFVKARARFAAAGGTNRADNGLQQRISVLRDLVEENRLALERAMAIQGRVLQVIARAAQRPAEGAGYNALRGRAGQGGGQGGAVALSVSA